MVILPSFANINRGVNMEDIAETNSELGWKKYIEYLRNKKRRAK